MKSRLKGAQTGHSLLKRKAEALTKRFRTITHRIDEVCITTRYTRLISDVHYLLDRVSYYSSNAKWVKSCKLHPFP